MRSLIPSFDVVRIWCGWCGVVLARGKEISAGSVSLLLAPWHWAPCWVGCVGMSATSLPSD